MDENSVDVGQGMKGISIVYGDESLPLLYENSEVSSRQLPGKEGIVKRAVALGRYLQSPLAMIATLCGAQKEIVSWKLHSLEHFLTPEEKYQMIEMVMVDVTNQVGVDINFAVSNDWLFAPLQFVSGLGPRKSAFLQQELVGGKRVDNRKDLARCGLRTKKIFCNAVGFLRVRGSELLSFGTEFNSFDDTRIHPESYGLAERFIKAVYNDIAEAQPIEYVKNNPQMLNDFDINAYADNYEIEQGENKKETLLDIKMELLHGFLDPCNPFQELTQDEEFYLISGKNEDAFAEGRIVQTIVRRVLSQRAFCALDFGMTGVVMKDDYSDETDDFSLTDKLHEGDILTCKISQIDKSRYQVFLTCKESELKSSRYQNLHEVEPYYCRDHSSLLSKQEKSHNEELEKKHFKPRMIFHPRFKNMTGDEAMEFLSDKEAGENIFHPSTRGPYYLTLTVKVCDGLFVHKEINEGEKDLKDITSVLRLGKTLKIGDHNYENLDEVMDQYVDPLVTHLKAMLSFRKFKRGSKAQVDELLRAEKSEYPTRIVYCFGISFEHPGTFILSYIRTNLHREYVGLHPKGFKFRTHIFGKVEELVAYFQKHIDDLKHESAPMRNAAAGSSAGVSMGSGDNNSWQGQQSSSRDKPSTSGLGYGGGKDYNGLPRPNGNRGRGRGHPSGLPRPDGERGRGRGRGRGWGRGRGRDNNEQLNTGNKNENSGYGFASKWGFDSKDENENNGGGRGSAKIGASSANWSSDCGWKEGNKAESTDGGNWGGCGRGRQDYHNNNTGETFTAAWGGRESGTEIGKNWDNPFGGNSGGWNGSNGGGNASGGSWGRSEESGRGRDGSWGGHRDGGASSGTFDRGGRGGRGNGRGRGHGHKSYYSGGHDTYKETFSGDDGRWCSADIGASSANWSSDCGWKEGNRADSTDGRNWGGRGHGGQDLCNDNTKETVTTGWCGSESGSSICGNWDNLSGGSSGGWNGSNEGRNASCVSWDSSEKSGRGRGGSWGGIGHREGGGSSGTFNRRGRGGRGNGRGHGRNSYNIGGHNTHKETFSSGWVGNGRDDARGGNWSNSGDGNTGGWVGSNKGRNTTSGSWDDSEEHGRGKLGDWSGRGGGRGSGNRGRSDGRGRGRGNGCGFGSGRDDNNHNGSDFGYNTSSWGTNTKDKSGDDDGIATFPGDNTGCGNWGARCSDPSVGNAQNSSWGGSGGTGNAGCSNWGGTDNDSQGILGSSPAIGRGWVAGCGNGGWGDKDGTGGSQSGFKTDSETGNTGWDAGSGRRSSLPAGKSGWSGNGSGGW